VVEARGQFGKSEEKVRRPFEAVIRGLVKAHSMLRRFSTCLGEFYTVSIRKLLLLHIVSICKYR
jgi:hypothetical protein